MMREREREDREQEETERGRECVCGWVCVRDIGVYDSRRVQLGSES